MIFDEETNMVDLVEALGLFAGTCTTLSFLPQLRKVIVTRSVSDISLLMYTMYCTGLILWTVYGICVGSISLILANSITLLFAMSIVVFKFRIEAR